MARGSTPLIQLHSATLAVPFHWFCDGGAQRDPVHVSPPMSADATLIHVLEEGPRVSLVSPELRKVTRGRATTEVDSSSPYNGAESR
jgi:hypothetical protein